MKALVVNALGRGFDLEDVQIATPMGREVLVDVQASGLCHTDLLFAMHDIVPTPAVLGHEVAGIVAEVGPDVAQFRVGDHVVGSLAQSCGMCARCLSGRPFQCQHPESTLRRPTDAPRLTRKGIGLFQGLGLGGFAERALIHENQLAVVPKQMPFAQAALLGCGVVTGAGAVLNTANVKAGDTVVIVGAGGVGLNAVSGARIAGASRIVVIDIQAKRLEAARRFGATDVIDSTKLKPVEAVRDLLPGGPDHVFDFVGLKAVAEQGLAMLGVGGGLYLVGVARPEVNIDLNIFDAIGGQKSIQGVNFGSTNFKRDIPMYAELYLQGRMNLDDLVSKEIALRDVNEGYAALEDGSLNRVVVTSFEE
ncbi:MAG TPA: zinc-binding dehydrogenase [Vicinamibacterales bacterium]|jgi:S-(hydroxymethyl)glutathione dehydrogenase/alcohol dehydrogenase|nr:zinc-binding dehydrogenase [Vicinamibacterales bacterium]